MKDDEEKKKKKREWWEEFLYNVMMQTEKESGCKDVIG